MLVWWVVTEVIKHSDPYETDPWWGLSSESLMMTLSQVRTNNNVLAMAAPVGGLACHVLFFLSMQWTLVFCILIGLNWWMAPIASKESSACWYLEHQPWYKRLARRIKTILLKNSDKIFEPVQTVTPPSEEASHVTDSGKEEYPMAGEKRTPPSLVVEDVEL